MPGNDFFLDGGAIDPPMAGPSAPWTQGRDFFLSGDTGALPHSQSGISPEVVAAFELCSLLSPIFRGSGEPAGKDTIGGAARYFFGVEFNNAERGLYAAYAGLCDDGPMLLPYPVPQKEAVEKARRAWALHLLRRFEDATRALEALLQETEDDRPAKLDEPEPTEVEALEPANFERRATLETMKAFPEIRAKWKGRDVRIWNGEQKQYWRRNNQGLTADETEAAVFRFEIIFPFIRRRGPKERLEFRAVSKEANSPEDHPGKQTAP